MSCNNSSCNTKRLSKKQKTLKKYNILGHQEKQEIVESLTKDASLEMYQSLSEKYNTSIKNLRRWYQDGIARKPGCGRKKLNTKAEEELRQWIIEYSLEQKKRVRRSQLKQQAIKLFNIPNFKASKAWQDEFIRNFDIKYQVNEILFNNDLLNPLQRAKFEDQRRKRQTVEKEQKEQSQLSTEIPQPRIPEVQQVQVADFAKQEWFDEKIEDDDNHWSCPFSPKLEFYDEVSNVFWGEYRKFIIINYQYLNQMQNKSKTFASLFQRSMFHSSHGLLKQRMREIVPIKQALLKDVRKRYGNKEICKVTVDQAIGGMRNVFGLFYDASLLDSKTGITMRDYNIPELQEYLQKAENGHEPLPEALFWLLLTGDFPSEQEFADVQQEWKERGKIDPETQKFIFSLPKEFHPMTMLSQTLLFLQKDSSFQQAYDQGKVAKPQYWEYFYEDSMDLLAKLPRVAALIYRHKYRNDEIIAADENLDWAGNYAHMLGYNKFEVRECLRGYLSIHADHEGGNVSAHTTHLVGSALADPYLSYSAGVNGLAGPLHGLANQEVLKWLLEMKELLGNDLSNEKIQSYVLNTIREGKVIPGYGHAVLRYTDPRFIHQKEFAARHIKDDPLVDLVRQCYHVIPPVLKTIGKIQNPWPNVDAHSGVLLYHYGMKEFQYYTVVFAVSRALGCMANLIWSRAFGLPIERPGSVTMRWIEEKYGENQSIK